MNPTTDNQYLDTNQSINQTQNELNLNVPQANQPNLLPNMNNNPQNIQNVNHQFNPQITQNYNTQINPQINQNYNPSFNPQINQNYNPSFNPQIIQNYNPSFNPVIQTAPTKVEVEIKPPPTKVRTKRTITGPVNLGLEPKKMTCPFCEEVIETNIEKSTNMKALITAIATLYIGFVMIQTCRGKAVGWEDCQHSCPKCNQTIGNYRAM